MLLIGWVTSGAPFCDVENMFLKIGHLLKYDKRVTLTNAYAYSGEVLRCFRREQDFFH